tara:strand:+ start:1309 stop:2295 length:987 start_codon:yes stop_codon:yes gene_type:complete
MNMPVNNLEAFVNSFEGITPYSGMSEPDFLVDFLGVKTAAEFRKMWGGQPTAGVTPIETSLPPMASGEGWFEAVNWVEAAREARGHYVMMTLGACYGNQAVGAYKALQAINPMPAKLVCVEGDPENVAWIHQHFRDNGIDPNDHWILEAALGADNKPILYPVGSPGSGAQNCYSTNCAEGRMAVAETVARDGRFDAMLYNLLLNNATGMSINLAQDSDYDFKAELKFVSATTLVDVLGPFDRVDYVESDIQQSEAIVFPPAIEALSRKVRRVHMGTHGGDVHQQMVDLFVRDGWELVFDYPPNSRFETPWGNFETNDGVLTVLNPRLA